MMQGKSGIIFFIFLHQASICRIIEVFYFVIVVA